MTADPDPADALQVAIFGALRGETEAGNAVYDEVPSDARQLQLAGHIYPRITIGEGQTVGNRADCYDGSEVFLQIDVWSTKTGYREVKQIASEVRSILDDDGDLTVAGHIVDLIEFRDTVYSRDPDGKTRRARINIRALTQPAV